MNTAGKPAILAVDTSTKSGNLALWKAGVCHTKRLTGVRHGEQLLDAMSQLCLQHGLQIGELHAIAVVCGPGSFTGVRLSVAVVQALAWSQSVPVIALDSLACLAFTRIAQQSCQVVLDARMGRVYSCAFSKAQWHTPMHAAQHLFIDDLLDNTDKTLPVLYAGEADTLQRVQQLGIESEMLAADANALGAYALAAWEKGLSMPVAGLKAVYLSPWQAA